MGEVKLKGSLCQGACPPYRRASLARQFAALSQQHCATAPLRHCATVPLCHCATVPLCHCTTVPLCHCATAQQPCKVQGCRAWSPLRSPRSKLGPGGAVALCRVLCGHVDVLPSVERHRLHLDGLRATRNSRDALERTQRLRQDGGRGAGMHNA